VPSTGSAKPDHPLAQKRPHHKRHRALPKVAAPVLWARASGGPERRSQSSTIPRDLQLASAVLAAPAAHHALPFAAELLLVVLVCIGLALIVVAFVPDAALRSHTLYVALVPRRVDIALVGLAILAIIGTIRLAAA
jgi:hypothetical protein